MPKYKVNVLYHKAYKKDMFVIANDQQEAEEKAVKIVESWDDVIDVEITDSEMEL